MGAPFSDITLYSPTPYKVGTPEYWEETSLKNFVSDLYVQNMNGYKPPKTTRITIQPAFHEIWDRTWKTGSIVAIAPFFSHDEYSSLDTFGKYKYVLDVIQVATIQLSSEYQWDKEVFEDAYRKTLESNFKFRLEYPIKQSRDKRKSARLVISKTEIITSIYVDIIANGSITSRKLLEKKNSWWYDCAYYLARHNKWIDTDRFGIAYRKGKIDILYSVEKDEVSLYEDGQSVTEINYRKYFLFN